MATRLADAERLLHEALAALRAVADTTPDDDDLLGVLRVAGAADRELQRITVLAAAALQRRGAFTARGQRPVTALADLLGIDDIDARRIVTGADWVCPRTDLQGQELPPRLPATAAAFAAGAAGLRHVQVIARLLASPAARRLPPDLREAAEAQIAAHAGEYTPTQLHQLGTDLLTALDQNGAEPDDHEPEPTNELFLTRNPNGSGGRIKGRFDDAALYDLVAAVIDAKATPLTGDDLRPLGQRQADAMAEVFGYVADHADTDLLPAAGGNRPHVNVHIRLEDLENRARAACLDFGGIATPAALRALCCDACVIPIVLDGSGQPLDVGRKTRTVPDGLRRAVAARDRGCAHPGCSRGPSWCQIHHIIPWERGGDTTLANLVMLCTVHHREIHSSGWAVHLDADGMPEFFPPAWIDPEQRPRRRPRLPLVHPGRGSSPPRGGHGPTAPPGRPRPLRHASRPARLA
ncbi:MAG TPA: DUF222 domain-containing protein [Pseudonocardia sp.]|nr:DUF222 domain-containing protein [Pseudonocardia sp.]